MSDSTPDFSTMAPGEIANLRYDMQQERKEAAAHVDTLKKAERKLDDFILENLLFGDTTKAGGSRGNISRSLTQIAVVNDWQALFAFIKENDAFELLQKRVGVTACKERWANEIEIPGVERGNAVKVHVSKAK